MVKKQKAVMGGVWANVGLHRYIPNLFFSVPGLECFPTATNTCALPEELSIDALCLCSQGFRTKHGQWQWAPCSRHLCCPCCGLEGRLGKIRSLSCLAEIACFCSFQPGHKCSFAEVKGPFPILDRAT